MKKVYFLVINEDLKSGLLQDQLLNPIKQNMLDKYDPVVFNIHRIGKSKYIDEEIRVINIPVLIPYKLFLFNRLYFLTPILALIYASILFFNIDKRSKLVVRSYFPGLVAYMLKKIANVNYVFDARSLFINEHANRIIGSNRRMWERFEKNILQNSIKNISVSHYQNEYYKYISESDSKNIVVHCFYDVETIITTEEKNRVRKHFGLNHDDVIVCYFGSLNKWWNNIEIYSTAFHELADSGIKVLIISQDYKTLSFNNANIVVVNTDENKNLDSLIQICDYGIILLEKNSDWKTRLSVKFAAYTCNGVPTILGQYVGEAVRISIKENIKNNLIVDYQNITRRINRLEKINANDKKKLLEIGNKYFKTEGINKYLQ